MNIQSILKKPTNNNHLSNSKHTKNHLKLIGYLNKFLLTLMITLFTSNPVFSASLPSYEYPLKRIPFFFFQNDEFVYAFMSKENIETTVYTNAFTATFQKSKYPVSSLNIFTKKNFWQLDHDGITITDINFQNGFLNMTYYSNRTPGGLTTYRPTRHGMLKKVHKKRLPKKPVSLGSSTNGHAVTSHSTAWFIDNDKIKKKLPASVYKKKCESCYFNKIILEEINEDIYLFGYRMSNCRKLSSITCDKTPFIVKYQKTSNGYLETPPLGAFTPAEKFMTNESIHSAIPFQDHLYLITTRFHKLNIYVIKKTTGLVEIHREHQDILGLGNLLGFSLIDNRLFIITSTSSLSTSLVTRINLYELHHSGELTLIGQRYIPTGHDPYKALILPKEALHDQIEIMVMGIMQKTKTFFSTLHFDITEQ